MNKIKKQYFRAVFYRLAFTGLSLLPWCWAGAAETDRPWYLEAAINHTDLSSTLSGFELYENDTGWSLSIGYAFNPYISVQATYHALASNYLVGDCPRGYLCLVQNVDQIDMSGVSASALFTWPISDMFDVFGQVGVLSWDADFQHFNHDESDEEFLYGAGLGVNLSDHWHTVLKHERFNFDGNTTSLGVVYKF